MPTGVRSRLQEIIKVEEMLIKLQENALDDNVKALDRQKAANMKYLIDKILPNIRAIELETKSDSDGAALIEAIKALASKLPE